MALKKSALFRDMGKGVPKGVAKKSPKKVSQEGVPMMKKTDQVGGKTQVKIVGVIPQFQLATIPNNQRLKSVKKCKKNSKRNSPSFKSYKNILSTHSPPRHSCEGPG